MGSGGGRGGWLGLAPLLLAAGCSLPAPVTGLRPQYPEARLEGRGRQPAAIEVDSLQPTLRWEAFPRPADLKGERTALLARVRDVTYDLRIWKEGEGAPLVYERRGLAAPSHKLESPLAPAATYLWSVRARFTLDGQPQFTGWSYTGADGAYLSQQPNLRSFRFQTPAK